LPSVASTNINHGKRNEAEFGSLVLTVNRLTGSST